MIVLFCFFYFVFCFVFYFLFCWWLVVKMVGCDCSSEKNAKKPSPIPAIGHPILSHLTSSRPISSHPVLCRPISSHLILSRLTSSRPIPFTSFIHSILLSHSFKKKKQTGSSCCVFCFFLYSLMYSALLVVAMVVSGWLCFHVSLQNIQEKRVT